MGPRNPKPHYHVTAGLIWRDGRVLITRRPEGTHLAGLWEFPGGKQEGSETLRACLEREIREELGVEVRARDLLMSVEHEYETKCITLHVFCCGDIKATPVAMEGQEAKWIRLSELSNHSFPPPDSAVIEMLTRPGSGCAPGQEVLP